MCDPIVAVTRRLHSLWGFERNGDVTPTTRACAQTSGRAKKKSAESMDSAQGLSICALSSDYAALATLRSDLKPARTSSENSCGCSQAAKWPPLSSLL